MGNTDKPHRILLGVILGAHGIKGDVKVRSFTDVPSDIASYGPLESEDGADTFSLKIVRETPKGLIAHIDGVDDRTSVEQLRETKLFVARDKLPAATGNSFYHVDLIGLTAQSPTGDVLGTIKDVHNFGAGDILELSLKDQDDTEMIPFTDDFVRDISVEDGVATLILPAASQDDETSDDPH